MGTRPLLPGLTCSDQVRAEGLYHSVDGGENFTKLANIQAANSLGFGKAAPGKKCSALYLAGKVDQVQGLFRSDDDGQSWVRINDDQHQFGWVNYIIGDLRIHRWIYFGTAVRGIIYGDLVPAMK